MNTRTTYFFALQLLLFSTNLMAQKGDSVCIIGRLCYKTPSEAFKNAKDGDTIIVYAGIYNDVAVINANHATMICIGVKYI